MLTPQEFARKNARLDEKLRERGRNPETIRRSMMTGCIFGKDEAALNTKLAAKNSTVEKLHERGMIVGNSNQVREQLDELEQVGVQRVMLQWQDLDDLEGLEVLAKAAGLL
jgi:alkanesulfonate monooxygenase SsuD/methylene tetrahydromethanopterin reductase-like flavin-dependent oxidoreductase (luciferase family)